MKEQFYGMRRANGDWFVLDIKGKAHVPIFRTLAAARRVKAMNPDLMVFRPSQIDERILQDLAGEQENHPITFWLVDEEDPANRLTRGQLLDREQVIDSNSSD